LEDKTGNPLGGDERNRTLPFQWKKIY
jgi:hypothetical protein